MVKRSCRCDLSSLLLLTLNPSKGGYSEWVSPKQREPFIKGLGLHWAERFPCWPWSEPSPCERDLWEGHVAKTTSGTWELGGPSWQLARKQRPQYDNCKELNLANHYVILEGDRSSQKAQTHDGSCEERWAGVTLLHVVAWLICGNRKPSCYVCMCISC